MSKFLYLPMSCLNLYVYRLFGDVTWSRRCFDFTTFLQYPSRESKLSWSGPPICTVRYRMVNHWDSLRLTIWSPWCSVWIKNDVVSFPHIIKKKKKNSFYSYFYFVLTLWFVYTGSCKLHLKIMLFIQTESRIPWERYLDKIFSSEVIRNPFENNFDFI